MAKTVGEAFRYDRMVLAAASYDGGLFPPMEHFLLKCKSKAYQNRTVALIENGSWAPCAAKKMKEMLEEMKNVQILDPVVTIRSAANAENEEQMKQLAQNLLTV
jgi:flavorubredoxin